MDTHSATTSIPIWLSRSICRDWIIAIPTAPRRRGRSRSDCLDGLSTRIDPTDPPVDYREFAYPAFTELLVWPVAAVQFSNSAPILAVAAGAQVDRRQLSGCGCSHCNGESIPCGSR